MELKSDYDLEIEESVRTARKITFSPNKRSSRKIVKDEEYID